MESPIAVALEDPEAFHDMLAALRAAGVPHDVLAAGAKAPPHVSVIVTDRGGNGDPREIPYTGPRETLQRALEARAGAAISDAIVLGIDPGPRPGVALLVNGRLVWREQMRNAEALRAPLLRLVAAYGVDRVLVRVGDRGGRYLRQLLPHLHGLRVEVVDERRTTQAATRAERDLRAAEVIASTPGTPGPPRVPPHPTEGEVREVQDLSRARTEGRVTLPHGLALRVARGELELDDALALL